MPKRFPRAGPDQRSNFIDERISRYLREAHMQLLDVADLKFGSHTLVLDCRDGWAAEEAWRRVRRGQVQGVDPSAELIDLAKQYREVSGQLEFRTWDQQTLPYGNGRFDTVLSSYSLHRYRAPDRVLSEAARVLKPGGRIVLLEPTKYAFGGLYLLVDWFNRVVDPGHVRYYSRRQILEKLRQGGFAHLHAVKLFQHFRLGGKLLANALLVSGKTGTSDGEH